MDESTAILLGRTLERMERAMQQIDQKVYKDDFHKSFDGLIEMIRPLLDWRAKYGHVLEHLADEMWSGKRGER